MKFIFPVTFFATIGKSCKLKLYLIIKYMLKIKKKTDNQQNIQINCIGKK